MNNQDDRLTRLLPDNAERALQMLHDDIASATAQPRITPAPAPPAALTSEQIAAMDDMAGIET